MSFRKNHLALGLGQKDLRAAADRGAVVDDEHFESGYVFAGFQPKTLLNALFNYVICHAI